MPDSVPLVFGRGDRPVIDRDYKLIKELGAGGFGQVWKASGEGTAYVALKIVTLAGLKEARRELSALKRLDEVRHANLVPVSAAYVVDQNRERLAHDDWDSDFASALIIVMTLCEKSLDRRLKECRREGLQGIPLEELLHFMEGASRGLDYLHKPNPVQGRDQAIVHCDIKPLNILVTGGEPQICDFGLARVFDTERTKYTTQIGSIAYMSPEVLLDGKAATPPSDQYAMAISYVELRTGLLPFGSGEAVTLSDVTSTLIKNGHRLDGLDDAERNVIRRAIARDPNKRYESCLAMVEALRTATIERSRGKTGRLFGKFFSRSGTVEKPESAPLQPPTTEQVPDEQESPAGSVGTLHVDQYDVSAERTVARKSTAPPAIGTQETAPLEPEGERRDWARKLSGKPAPDAGKGSRPRSVFRAATALAVLAATIAAVDHFGQFGGRQYLTGLVESSSEEPGPPPSPTPGPSDDPQPSDSESTVDPLPDTPEAMDTPPGDTPSAWRVQAAEFVAAKDLAGLSELLDNLPADVTPDDTRPIREQARALWSAQFDAFVKAATFPHAVAFLEQYPPEEFGEDLEACRSRLGSDWLGHVRTIWSANPSGPNSKTVLREAEGLLEQFPDSAEARLIKARGLVDQAKAAGSGDELEAIDESDLPEEQHLLYRMLGTIVLGERADVDWDELARRLLELDANRPPDASNAFLKWTKFEDGWLERHRRAAVGSLRERADRQIKSERFADARADLDLAGKLASEEDRVPLLCLRVAAELGDPQAVREQLDGALATAEELIPPESAEEWRVGRAGVEKLAVAIGSLGRHDDSPADAELLDRALRLLRSACDRFPVVEGLLERFAELLSRRTILRIAEPEPSTEEELLQLQDDWNRAARARAELPIVHAWRAECLVSRDKVRNADDLLDGGDEPLLDDANLAAYTAYVRALVQDASPRRRPEKVLEALDEMFRIPEDDRPVLAAQDRLPTAARLILAATGGQLPTAGKSKKTTEDYLWGNPFPSPDDAARHVRLLGRAEAILGAGAGDMQRPLDTGLMLAALHSDPADAETAWSHAARLSESLNAEPVIGDLPVLASCVRAYLLRMDSESVDPADYSIAVRACTRLLKLAEDATAAPGGLNAVRLHEEMLNPLLTVADSYADDMADVANPDVDPAVLEKFYAAAGRFIWQRKFIPWPFGNTTDSVAKESARLFGWAIHLHESVHGDNPTEEAAEYYLTCGHATLATHQPDLDLVESYADKVLDLRPDSYEANGLKSNIRLTRSRQQLSRADHLRLLDEAIEVGSLAVEHAPDDEPSLAGWLINLGTAYVERANFTRDLSFDTQEADLNRAIEAARRAAALENTNPDYPYLILGNAYEDLAWLVRRDVEENYRQAIESFWTARESQKLFRAQAMYGLGRCYYKVVVDSHLDPGRWRFRDLDQPSADEMLAKAGSHLLNATAEDPALADAFFYLGLVKLNRSDVPGADADFLRAKNAALEKSLPSVGVYALQWALTAGEHDETGLVTIESRVEVLQNEAGPLAGVLHGAARSAKVQLLVNGQEFSEALDVIDRALPDDPADWNSQHVSLLQQRVRCRKGLLPADWNWDTAGAALSDARRALDLAYTRAEVAEALYLSATVRNAVSERLAQAGADAGNGPPADLQGTEISQLTSGIGEIRQAVELLPDFEEPKAAERRFLGALLVWQKMNLIKTKGLELSSDEAESYRAELRQGIDWTGEFPRIPNTQATDKTYCEQMKAAFGQEIAARSKPAGE